MNIPDCPPVLAPLLRRLFNEAETEITQHEHSPRSDRWYAGRTIGALGGGDYGPYASAEDAIVALVRTLWTRYDEVRAERDQAEAERDAAIIVADGRRLELDRLRRVVGQVGGQLVKMSEQGGEPFDPFKLRRSTDSVGHLHISEDQEGDGG
jgi:hypothetical protein